MAVINISKDGALLTDLVGRVVTVTEARPVYELIRNMNAKREEGIKDRDKYAQAGEPRGMVEKKTGIYRRI